MEDNIIAQLLLR